MSQEQRKSTFRLMAGLGNQLFICASAFGLSQTWNRRPEISSAWFDGRQRGTKFESFRRPLLADRFPGIVSRLSPVNSFPWVPDQMLHKSQDFLNSRINPLFIEQKPGFDNKLLSHPRRYIVGYLQSPEYFRGHRSELIKMFALDQLQEEGLQARLDAISPRATRRVMIHVRREDALVPGNDWPGLLSPEYYSDAMDSFYGQGVEFIVFSDSPDWCESQQVFRNAHIVREPDPVLTLRMMSHCDDFIIAGSTLSWWGAWLGRNQDKRVIAPTPFYRRSTIDNWKELVLPEWSTLAAKWDEVGN